MPFISDQFVHRRAQCGFATQRNPLLRELREEETLLGHLAIQTAIWMPGQVANPDAILRRKLCETRIAELEVQLNAVCVPAGF